MSASRGVVYHVVPVGGRWVVRAGGHTCEIYDRLEDALVAAEALVGQSDVARNLHGATQPRDSTPAADGLMNARLTSVLIGTSETRVAGSGHA